MSKEEERPAKMAKTTQPALEAAPPVVEMPPILQSEVSKLPVRSGLSDPDVPMMGLFSPKALSSSDL